jgi:hypothetical protein
MQPVGANAGPLVGVTVLPACTRGHPHVAAITGWDYAAATQRAYTNDWLLLKLH